MKFLKNFIWGTFNKRNKGIPVMKWWKVGFYYACARYVNN